MDTAKARATASKWLLRVLLWAGLAFVVFAGLYTTASLNYTYSSGERVGFVQKMSKRGWVCKTNEGDLAMVNIAGQPAQMFAFTVRDDKIVQQIEALAGHKVALHYEEHAGIPSSCFGDTRYFVTEVQKAE
ncbi:MAG: hypothetical protein M3O50_02280 [Myxococcota bacterium]|nr:hypothetical protein [Myxococcota bacterium]